MSRDRLLNIIGEIYESADDESRWSQCLSSIGSLLNGTSTNLIYHHYGDPLRGSLELATGADPELYRWYLKYGQSIDPWALAMGPGRYREGKVILGASVIDHAAFARTEFYASMGRRHLTTRVVVGVLDDSPRLIGVLSINRGDPGEEFDDKDARTVSVLLPHLRRALGIRRRLRSLAAEHASIVDAMDTAQFGIVLVDERAWPVFANRYARRLLAERDGLTIDGEWWAATPQVTERLRTSIARAIAVTKGESLELGETVLMLPRRSDPPLRAAITPVNRYNEWLNTPGRVAAIVLLVDPTTTPSPADRIAELFELTPAEARVAFLFAGARTVHEISNELGISRETVRTHVKRVLAKAGVSTQAQFVQLVASGVTRLATGDGDIGH